MRLTPRALAPRFGARRAIRRFARDTRAVAGIAAALLTVGTVAGAALIVDHVWLVDQRDVLKTAAEAASTAATLELVHNPGISDADLQAVAERYVLINLAHLPSGRLQKAKDSLEVDLDLDNKAHGTVKVIATADLGGTLFSRHLPLLGNYEGPEDGIKVEAGVDSDSKPAEVVLALDISTSMEFNLAGNATPLPGSQVDPARIDIIKKAALDLVHILEPDADNRVAVGVVPWHTQVRLDSATAGNWEKKGWAVHPRKRRYEVPYLNCGIVGRSRRRADCTNLPAGVEQALPPPDHQAWAQCLDEHRTGSGTTAAQPGTLAERLAPPSQNPFAQTWFPAGFGFAYQCLNPQSDDFPADLRSQYCYELPSGVVPPSGSNVTVIDRDQRFFCPSETAPILPLSTEPDEIKQAIRALVPTGKRTYSALGVLWGQRLLSPSWKSTWGGGVHPVGPTDPDADKVRKAIVLLTDGQDTHCGLGNHGCDDSDVGLSRAEACTEAKRRGTEIFVVAAMMPANISTAFGNALEACSSQNDAEYDAENPDAGGTRRPGGNYVFLNNATPERLDEAFKDIASQIRTLRRVL